MIETRLSRQSLIDLALLGFLWGGSFLSIRIALDEVSVLSAVVHRVGWAALVLWAVVLLRGLPVPRDLRSWGAFAVMGLLNNVLPFSLMSWGQLYIETGLTSILNAATAVFGVLVAALIFADERVTLQRGIGVGLGFAGVVTVVGWQVLMTFDLRSLAQMAVLAGTVSYALAGAWARLYLAQMPPQVAAAGMLTASTIIMLAATLFVEGDIDLPTTLQGSLSIAYYTLAATALAYLLYYRIVARSGAGNLMLVTLLIPPIAILLGALVLGETLHPSAFVGFGLLAAGLVILQRAPRR